MSSGQKWLIAGAGVFLLLCACLVLACVATGGLALSRWTRAVGEVTPGTEATRVITVQAVPARATGTPTPASGIDEPAPTQAAAGASPVPEAQPDEETVDILENEVVPQNDPRDLARRLEGKQNIPETIPGPAAPLAAGTEEDFWVTNTGTNETFSVRATLRHVSEHLYFWIENGVEYNNRDLQRLGEVFDTRIYPTNRKFFGSEWNPGIDNDPRLYILYARGLGGSVAGYYSSSDEFHPDAREYSNAHEMFLISADIVDLGSPSIEGVIAHEFQHMIHAYQDRNEEVWLSEGFSELAMLVNGYDTGGTEHSYVSDPDLQLNTWPADSSTYPYYGAAFLFSTYLLDRFGDGVAREIVANPENGLESVDAVLAAIGAADPRTGSPIGADDVFADWVIASYLNDSGVEQGQYAYRRYARPPQPGLTEEVRNCSAEWEDREVRQYGVDYIRVGCGETTTLWFEGAEEVGVVPVDPYSGKYAFWSNRGDESDMTLTRAFDFTQASGPLTLTYQTWYEIEEDYDYLYLVVSEDGENWQILRASSSTEDDPTGLSYGWAYNGYSGGWIEESVDLSAFAGKQVQVRFEYITDMAVNLDGFLLDDVRIPEINYFEDFETGDGGWEGSGFVRIQNRLPQAFRIAIIRQGRTTSVETVRLEAGQTASIPLQLGEDIRGAVLVVSGTTRYTTQPAGYRFRFDK
jgi:hypothetical protein